MVRGYGGQNTFNATGVLFGALGYSLQTVSRAELWVFIGGIFYNREDATFFTDNKAVFLKFHHRRASLSSRNLDLSTIFWKIFDACLNNIEV